LKPNWRETGKFPNNNLFLFYGKPKSGKSSFVATWDNPLVFDLESGYNNISADIITPKTYQEFLKELHNPKNLKPYDNIIIDTIDIFPHGSGWASARVGLKKFIMGDLFNIKRMDKNVILVAHEKSITITRNGKEENAFTLSLPGQTASMVESLADADPVSRV
jgi:archaellum biogenesis ATPase FlaH